MAYRMTVDGLTEFSGLLDKLGDSAQSVASQALYEGAGMMAEAINKGAEGIKTEPFHYAREGTRLPSPEEKAIVEAASAGIAKFDKGADSVDTAIGFRNAGYAMLGNKEKPIPQIVNAINSGTSFMQKQPFVRSASTKARTKVLTAMKEKIESSFDAITKETTGG